MPLRGAPDDGGTVRFASALPAMGGTLACRKGSRAGSSLADHSSYSDHAKAPRLQRRVSQPDCSRGHAEAHHSIHVDTHVPRDTCRCGCRAGYEATTSSPRVVSTAYHRVQHLPVGWPLPPAAGRWAARDVTGNAGASDHHRALCGDPKPDVPRPSGVPHGARTRHTIAVGCGGRGRACAVVRNRVHRDELRLQERVGTVYDEYCSQVPRWLPRFSPVRARPTRVSQRDDATPLGR